jgi:hypothetical protein
LLPGRHDNRLKTAAAPERLSQYGFRPERFAGAFTSGEEAIKFLSQQLQTTDDKGGRVLFWTWDDRIPSSPRVTASPQRLKQSTIHPNSVTMATLLLPRLPSHGHCRHSPRRRGDGRQTDADDATTRCWLLWRTTILQANKQSTSA